MVQYMHPYFSLSRQALRKLLNTCAADVPYYRRLFKALRFDPVELETYEQFVEIPITTKDNYRQYWKDFISQRVKMHESKLDRRITSGSTGTPLTIYKSREDTMRTYVLLWRERSKICHNISRKRRAQFYAVNESYARNIRERHVPPVRFDPKVDEIFINTSKINDESLTMFWKALCKYRPLWLSGSPHIIDGVASFAQMQPYYTTLDSVKYIECHSEYLFESVSKNIEKTFKTKPTSVYGANEIRGVALMCKYSRMHILTDNAFVEILDSNGTPVSEDQIGTVFVTTLVHFDTPLVRYDLGDTARWENPGLVCPCGNNSPSLILTGYRETDYFKKEDNTLIDGWCITGIFGVLKHIHDIEVERFQLIQSDYKKFILNLKLECSLSQRLKFEVEFKKQLEAVMDSEVEIVFYYPKRIQLDEMSGKFKHYICEV